MNSVSLIGRLTKDPDVRYGTGDNPTAVARYTLAVDRRYKKDEADFINCVAFGKNGEFVEKYFRKGQKVGVCGSIRTGSYTDKEGNKKYTTDVVTTEHYFCEKAEKGINTKVDDDFMEMPDDMEEELPFM